MKSATAALEREFIDHLNDCRHFAWKKVVDEPLGDRTFPGCRTYRNAVIRGVKARANRDIDLFKKSIR